MNHPKIIKSVFEPEMDKAINTALLRSIFKEFGVEYNSEANSFTSPLAPWGVMIADQHDNHEVEPEPHYVLLVGEGDFEKDTKYSYSTKYCDYKSSTDVEEDESIKEEKDSSGEEPLGIIVTNPGTWTIHVWLPENHSICSDIIARNISNAYADVMAEVLPEYFIPSSSNFVSIG